MYFAVCWIVINGEFRSCYILIVVSLLSWLVRLHLTQCLLVISWIMYKL